MSLPVADRDVLSEAAEALDKSARWLGYFFGLEPKPSRQSSDEGHKAMKDATSAAAALRSHKDALSRAEADRDEARKALADLERNWATTMEVALRTDRKERDSARAERDEADTLLEEARTIIGAIPYVDPISVMEWRQIHSTLGKIDAHLAKKGAP